LPVGREFDGKLLKNICEFMVNGLDQLYTGCAGGSSRGKA